VNEEVLIHWGISRQIEQLHKRRKPAPIKGFIAAATAAAAAAAAAATAAAGGELHELIF
jgi:hypothetical protein